MVYSFLLECEETVDFVSYLTSVSTVEEAIDFGFVEGCGHGGADDVFFGGDRARELIIGADVGGESARNII